MPLVPFPEWKPDNSDYEGNSSLTISGVVPTATGYAPWYGGTAVSQALLAACRGCFQARANDGTITTFAGTSTKLYKLPDVALSNAWIDVSKGAGTYVAVNSTDNWSFAQIGNIVIAVQVNTTPQWYDLTSSTAFADFSSHAGYVGSVPNARYVSIVGRFVVLGSLLTDPLSIQWSGLNAPFTWDGTNSSSSQQLPDGGVVRGIAGGELSGLIFQDTAIRKMTYTSEAVIVFQIERISQDKGLFVPNSLIRAGETVFYLSLVGLMRIDPGGLPVEVGKGKFNNTLMADIDTLFNARLCMGVADPNESRIFIAYKSVNGFSGQTDKMLCYDYLLDKATTIPITAEFVCATGLVGATSAQLAAFNTSHIMTFFTNTAIEAYMDTGEQGTDGTRMRIRGLRPITDGGSGTKCGLLYRENVHATPTTSTEVAIVSTNGLCPFNISTRYARLRLHIQAGTTWTYADGIEPDVVLEGKF